jgi:glycosyltransferase involved in cell wall biosynthesis
VEVIIPAYNCKETIDRTLDSLVDQINKNFTVLVVDDCSTQDIRSIVENYKNKLNIRYVRNNCNVGCGMSRQRGIDETTADYIAFLDSDDVLLPNAIDTWLHEIENKRPEVLYSRWFAKWGSRILKGAFYPLHMCHGKVYSVEFLKKYNIAESEAVKCNDDLYLNLQAFDLATNISIVNEPTYIYINNKNSVTHQDGFAERGAREREMVISMASNHIKLFKDNPLEQYKRLEESLRW